MKYVKIDNGEVVQVQTYAQKGFIEAPDNVICGMLLVAGEFVDPPPIPPSDDEMRTESMLVGADYNGYQISFTVNDGNGMLQAKAAFELGVADTVIHFKNDTKMPIIAADFPVFAAWFVQQRNSYFV